MGKIIAVANQKGGVGKTTTAVNLAASLGVRGYKVLLVDMDPQGNTTQGIGVNKKNIKNGVYEAMLEKCTPKEAILSTEYKNLDIMTTTPSLIGAEIELVELEDRESCLKMVLNAVRLEYDFIFIDCPPSLGLLTLNALCSADSILLPIQCEFYALVGLSQLLNHIRGVKRRLSQQLEIEGVLLTMYDGRLNLTQQVADEVKKYFPKKVYATVIPRTVRLSEAPSFGQPIYYFDRSTRGAKAYEDLADEFLKKNK